MTYRSPACKCFVKPLKRENGEKKGWRWRGRERKVELLDSYKEMS